MRVLIVDDESAARRRLSTLLEDLGVEIAGEAADGLAALTLCAERRPDVLLLDVSMPEVDGFDVARHLADPRPLIIFQTAHAEHALRAFDHDALDYVVKPVTRERLAQALDRAGRRLSSTPSTWTADELGRLGSAMGYAPARPARLLVRHLAGHRLVPMREIVRFSAVDGLVHAHTPSGTPATDYTLNELESRHANLFLRVSRSDLVSLSHIQGIRSNGDGSATLTLSDGTSVHVSRRRAAAVRTAIHRLS